MRVTQILLRSSKEFKYFQRYIERELSHDHLRRKWHPISGWKELKRTRWNYDEHRPWTEEFKRNNMPGSPVNKDIYVLPIKEWKMFKGDRVEVMVGRDKGKIGIINCIIKERNWVFVEGLNCEFKLISQYPDMPPTCIKDERPLLYPKQIKLVDPSDEKWTDVEWRYTETGERVRVSARTGRIIPMPELASETPDADMVLPKTYSETDKDTRKKDVTDVTFEPRLMTFQEEIMDTMGIKEDRIPAKTYWY